jgi:PAS domain-containing protein
LGEIDAVVVNGPEGDRVFTLEGADRPYRTLVESMNEGAATVTVEGLVLYGNRHLASLLAVPSSDIVGAPLSAWLSTEDGSQLIALLDAARAGKRCGRVHLDTSLGFAAQGPNFAELSCSGWRESLLRDHYRREFNPVSRGDKGRGG